MLLGEVFGLGSESESVDGAAAGVVFVSTGTSEPVEVPVLEVIDLSGVVRATVALLFTSLAGAAVLASIDLFA